MKCIYNVENTHKEDNCLRIRVYLNERAGFANFNCINILINETNMFIKFDI